MTSCIFDGRRQHRTSDFIYDIKWVKTCVPVVKNEVLLKPVNSKNITKQAQADTEAERNSDEETGPAGSQHSSITNIAVSGKDPLMTNDNDDSSKEYDINDQSIFLIAQNINSVTALEAHVYCKDTIQYCFDLPISPQPMCLEWLNYDPDQPSNFCAIGSRNPIIEVWDLCHANSTEPFFKLGRKANIRSRLRRIGHKNLVVDLAWNQNRRHILASSSIDGTILLWDLETHMPIEKHKTVEREAFSIKWNPQETDRLLTGCLDKKVRIRDCTRGRGVLKEWNVPGLPQKVLWNHHNTNYCIVSLEGGYISYFDVRANKAVWEIKPHGNGNVTGLILSASYPGLLISSSDNGLIKIWDIINHEPTFVYKKRDPSLKLHVAANPYNELILNVYRINPLGRIHTETLELSKILEVQDRFVGRIVSRS